MHRVSKETFQDTGEVNSGKRIIVIAENTCDKLSFRLFKESFKGLSHLESAFIHFFELLFGRVNILKHRKVTSDNFFNHSFNKESWSTFPI